MTLLDPLFIEDYDVTDPTPTIKERIQYIVEIVALNQGKFGKRTLAKKVIESNKTNLTLKSIYDTINESEQNNLVIRENDKYNLGFDKI